MPGREISKSNRDKNGQVNRLWLCLSVESKQSIEMDEMMGRVRDPWKCIISLSQPHATGTTTDSPSTRNLVVFSSPIRR